MFLRCKVRQKNGKEQRSWSVVENQRLADGRVLQRHVLYLGEINDSQNLAWRKSIEAFLEDQPDVPPTTLALFPEDTPATSIADEDIVSDIDRACLLPIDFSGQRMEAASAVVCVKRDGRFIGRRFWIGQATQTLRMP